MFSYLKNTLSFIDASSFWDNIACLGNSLSISKQKLQEDNYQFSCMVVSCLSIKLYHLSVQETIFIRTKVKKTFIFKTESSSIFALLPSLHCLGDNSINYVFFVGGGQYWLKQGGWDRDSITYLYVSAVQTIAWELIVSELLLQSNSNRELTPSMEQRELFKYRHLGYGEKTIVHSWQDLHL